MIGAAGRPLTSVAPVGAFVQKLGTKYTTAATATQVITLTVNTTAGNTVIVVGSCANGNFPTTVSDSKGNTYTKDTFNNTNRALVVFSAYITTQLVIGDTITIHNSAATGNRGCIVAEYSGIVASTRVTQAATKHSTAATTATSTTLTPSTSGVLWITAWTQIGTDATATVTVAAPFTKRVVQAGGRHSGLADFASTGTAAESATWTWHTSVISAISLVAYKT